MIILPKIITIVIITIPKILKIMIIILIITATTKNSIAMKMVSNKYTSSKNNYNKENIDLLK